MSAKQPEIKFSPFEALLIGEKNNRVLKRQPMKNTIFVTRLNQKRKFINLRALFGLEKYTTSSRSNGDIFKMPQRVYEFFNNKKHSYENSKITENKGRKMFVKNDSVKPKHKKSKTKSNKVKFKEKCNKVQESLKNHSKVEKHNLTKRNNGMPKGGLKKGQGDMCSTNRYRLRSKDSTETEYESSQSNEVNDKIKQNYLSNYMCKFLMDNNKNIFNNDNEINLSDPNTLLNELFKHNYYCQGGFEFPKCPETGISDFDNDENLVDIIYENFPTSIKFESKDSSSDFIDTLINAAIIKPVEDLETNTTKEVLLEEDKKIKVSCGTQTSSMDLPRPIDLSSCYHLQTLSNGYIAAADGFVTIQNHLITDDNFGGLFLNNPNSHNRNDLIMLSLMKPLLHSSWVGSLQNF